MFIGAEEAGLFVRPEKQGEDVRPLPLLVVESDIGQRLRDAGGKDSSLRIIELATLFFDNLTYTGHNIVPLRALILLRHITKQIAFYILVVRIVIKGPRQEVILRAEEILLAESMQVAAVGFQERVHIVVRFLLADTKEFIVDDHPGLFGPRPDKFPARQAGQTLKPGRVFFVTEIHLLVQPDDIFRDAFRRRPVVRE